MNTYKRTYIPEPVDFTGGWEQCREAMTRNSQKLEEIDAEAKKAGTLVGRYFGIPVADGQALYIVTSETATRVKLQHCTGLGDDYRDHHFGTGGSFSKKEVLGHIQRRDRLDELFRRR